MANKRKADSTIQKPKIKKHQPSHSIWVRTICLIIVLFFVVSLVLSLAGCSNVNNVSQNFDTLIGKEEKYRLDTNKHGDITDTTLVEAVVVAINDTSEVERIYNSLPKHIVGDLTKNEFAQYISALTGDRTLKIKRFYRENTEEAKKVSQKLLTIKPEFAEKMKRTQFYRLEIDSNANTENNPLLAIQHDENDKPLLDVKWIREIIAIYRYAKLYFHAVSNKDRDSISYLLLQSENTESREKLKEIAEQKASSLLDYYQNSVRTAPEDSKLTLLLPGIAEFKQELYTSEGNNLNYRTCQFQLQQGRYVIKDSVADELASRHITVYLADRVFLFGDPADMYKPYSGNYFLDELGEPIGVEKLTEGATAETIKATTAPTVKPTVAPVEDKTKQGAVETIPKATVKEETFTEIGERLLNDLYNQRDGDSLWRIKYPGIELTIRGNAEPKSYAWAGYITQVDLLPDAENNVFSLGQELKIGTTVPELYQVYPFIREASYELETTYAGIKWKLNVQVARDQITKLSLRQVDYAQADENAP